MRADEGGPYRGRLTRASPAMAAVAVAFVAACALPARLTVPANLEPGAGESLTMQVSARGVQIYECRVKSGAPGYEWAFVAPEAELLDMRGAVIGSHGAGPHWRAPDGSRIEGVVKARADAPAAGTIPWLLLSARSTGSPGIFSRVTSVQRVETTGGIAPLLGCEAAQVGQSVRVPYSAVYRFFGA